MPLRKQSLHSPGLVHFSEAYSVVGSRGVTLPELKIVRVQHIATPVRGARNVFVSVGVQVTSPFLF